MIKKIPVLIVFFVANFLYAVTDEVARIISVNFILETSGSMRGYFYLNDPDVDLQIAGSGTGGLGRYNMPYDPDNITLERKNQRFIIQLVVKAEDMSIR